MGLPVRPSGAYTVGAMVPAWVPVTISLQAPMPTCHCACWCAPWLTPTQLCQGLTRPLHGQVGAETFRLCQQLVDGVVLVDNAATSAAIRDIFNETRSILEPSGALGVAGAKAYLQRHGLKVQLRVGPSVLVPGVVSRVSGRRGARWETAAAAGVELPCTRVLGHRHAPVNCIPHTKACRTAATQALRSLTCSTLSPGQAHSCNSPTPLGMTLQILQGVCGPAALSPQCGC